MNENCERIIQGYKTKPRIEARENNFEAYYSLTTDEIADEAIDNFIKEIIDDLTITMDKTYRLDKPPFWLIEWIKKFKKEDYKNL